MKRGRPGAYSATKRHLEQQDSDWVHQSEQKYSKHRDIVDLIGPQRAMPGMFVPDPRKTRPDDYRVFRPMADWKASRVARYPRKRTYAKRKYTSKYGRKGSRFYYSRYNPKSYYVRGSAANVKRFGSSFRNASKTQQLARKRVGYYGRGKYGVFGKAYNFAKQPSFQHGFKQGVAAGADLLGAGAAAAKFVAPEYAVPLAAVAGAAQVASGYMGRGSYVSHPVKHGMNDLMVGGKRSLPTMHSNGDEQGAVLITHTERVADVIAPPDSLFHCTGYDLNPGLERTFGFLSQLAANFDEYEFIQCVFEYRGHDMVGSGGTDLDLNGQVLAATQYNSTKPLFDDRHEMQAYAHATECSMNGKFIAGVECDPDKTAGDDHKYIRVGGLSREFSKKDHDHGRFELALYNTPDTLFNKEVGQLFCTYTVKLMKPKLFGGRGRAISSYRARCVNAEDLYPFGTTNAIDGAEPLACALNTMEMAVTRNANNTVFTFPAEANGVFFVHASVEAGSIDNDTELDITTFVGQCTSFSSDRFAEFESKIRSSIGTDRTHVIGYVRVRPQLGNTKNSFSITSNLSGDSVIKSAVVIEEINSFGFTNSGVYPEYIGQTTGARYNLTGV